MYAARSSASWMAWILLKKTAFTAGSGPITAICAVGSARHASGSNAGPHMAYNPAPYALRTITETLGTVASVTAVIIFAPWRVIPSRSTAGPIMKPGAAAGETSGTLKASHSQMKPAALSAGVTHNKPPQGVGL